MSKLLNDGVHWNGTIYRNNANRWRDSWTLLDNPILTFNAAYSGGSSTDIDDEGFYGSCCLGDYADLNGKWTLQLCDQLQLLFDRQACKEFSSAQ